MVLGAEAEQAQALLTRRRCRPAGGRGPRRRGRGLGRAAWPPRWPPGSGRWPRSGPRSDAVVVLLVDLPDVGAAVVVARRGDLARGRSRPRQRSCARRTTGSRGTRSCSVATTSVALAAEVASALQAEGPADYGARHYLADKRCSWWSAATSPAGTTWTDRRTSCDRPDPTRPAPDELAERLGAHRLPVRRRAGDRGLPGRWTSTRPLLLEGEPGTGKTALAEALAESMGVPLIRLQCYEGIDASQALYDWDFPRQILHLRALESSAPTVTSRRSRTRCSPTASCSPGPCCAPCGRARRCC